MKPTGQTTYTSMKSCAAATLIPLKTLKAAKNMGAPGFKQNGVIIWDLLEPWLNENKETVDVATVDNIEFYKKEIAKREVQLKELQIEKLKGQMIDPDDVEKFLVELSSKLSGALKTKKLELTSKCTGYESVIDSEFNGIFNLIKEELTKWKRDYSTN